MSGNILQGRTLKSTIPTESRLIIPSPISHFIEKKQTTQTFLLQGLSKLLYHLDKDELHCFIRQQQVSSSSLMGQAVLKHTLRHGPLYGPSQMDFQRSASSALSSQGSVQNQEWTHPTGFQHQEEQKWNFQTSPELGLLRLQANSMHPIREFLRKMLKVNIQLKNYHVWFFN